MSLRRIRVHHCGISNIDFRSKNDAESLKIFQPWKNQKNFGSMGCIDYHLPHDKFNELFDVSKELNTQKDIRQESPDPKVWSSAKLYKLKKIYLSKRNMNINDKLSELDESIKGKDKFVGDSMMISDIRRSRFERKTKIINELEQRKPENQVNISKKIVMEPKKSKSTTNNNKIDININKIKDIRNELRLRYENSNNMRKLFKEWDLTLSGEVSEYDIHSILNKRLNMQINHNEVKVLIAYSNKRNTNALNIEEFIHLIYNDDPVCTKDMSPIKSENEIEFNEGSKLNQINALVKNNITDMNKSLDYHYLKKCLHTKTNTLMKNITDIVGPNEAKCDLDTFTKALRKLPLNILYLKEPFIKSIYDEYIDIDSQKMNYRKFIDDCLTTPNEKSSLYGRSSHRTIELFKEKINDWNQRLPLDFEGKKRKILIEAYHKQIEEKKILNQQSHESIQNEVNSCQPSLEFINKIFKDRKSRYKKYNEIESSFRFLPSLVNILSPKTRFNGNPLIKNTALNVQADEKSFMYQNEKDRFNIRKPNTIDIVHLEKELRYSKRNKKWERISETMAKAQSSCNILMQSNEQRDLRSQLFKTKKFLEYESLNYNKNKRFQE